MSDLTERLLELNRLHAGAVLNGTAAGDHNHLAAANRALFKAWPDIAAEITRLTGHTKGGRQ